MSTWHLDLAYPNFLLIDRGKGVFAAQAREAFSSLPARLDLPRGRDLEVWLYGASSSGVYAHSQLQDIPGLRITRLIDWNRPCAPLAHILHSLPQAAITAALPGLLFVAAAPEHYGEIQQSFIERLPRGPKNVVFMFQEDTQTPALTAQALRFYEEIKESIAGSNCGADFKKRILQEYEAKAPAIRLLLNNTIYRIPLELRDTVILDWGCNVAGIFPLLHFLGAKKLIGVEALPATIAALQLAYAGSGMECSFLLSRNGYIDQPSGSVDLVLLIEVISHINPSYLSATYNEIHRVLKPGGMVFIADGNNLDAPGYFGDRLRPLYLAIENGPKGILVEGEIIERPYRDLRKALLQELFPRLTGSQADYLADNTSGLHGEMLFFEAERYLRTGRLTERAYRPGTFPVHPENGMVMERPFYPEQVRRELQSCGFDAWYAPLGGLRDHEQFQILGCKQEFFQPAAGPATGHSGN